MAAARRIARKKLLAGAVPARQDRKILTGCANGGGVISDEVGSPVSDAADMLHEAGSWRMIDARIGDQCGPGTADSSLAIEENVPSI
jgi:hypothetical protein